MANAPASHHWGLPLSQRGERAGPRERWNQEAGAAHGMSGRHELHSAVMSRRALYVVPRVPTAGPEASLKIIKNCVENTV